MKVEYRKQFISNMQGIKNKDLADEFEFILEFLNQADNISEIPGVKILTGHSDYYRIRVEDYRIGIKLSGKKVIVVCFYHRSKIYTLFP